jgi:hypothetical protein
VGDNNQFDQPNWAGIRHDEALPHPLRHGSALLPSHEMQQHIESSRRTGRSNDLHFVDIERVRLYTQLWIASLQIVRSGKGD